VKIRTVEFAGSVASPDGPIPGDLPQVAFSGRSNVGKSSLINALLQRTRRKIAKVSGTPGKTQLLNFYRVNDHFFLVDLPGFGFAKAPASVRHGWQQLIEGYLSSQERLRGVVHLVDCRRTPADLDLKMLDYLAGLGLPTLIVLTKIDKLGETQRKRSFKTVQEALGVDGEQLLPFSAKNGEGREELLAALESLLHPEAGEDA
jgi:GTP-binding protein